MGSVINRPHLAPGATFPNPVRTRRRAGIWQLAEYTTPGFSESTRKTGEMSATAQAPKPKRRIAPIALATSAPALAAAPAATSAAPAPTPQAATARLPALERAIQQNLTTMRNELGAMINAPFVPPEEALDDLDAGLCRVRACVRQYHETAAVAEREAATERERLAAELKPVKIERTEATKAIYDAHKAKMGGQCRYLYKCPRADALGLCAHGSASRPFRPSARNHVLAHIERFHLGNDPLRTQRRSDAWWAEGADQTRANARRAKAQRNA